jgi:hypothetical protein
MQLKQNKESDRLLGEIMETQKHIGISSKKMEESTQSTYCKIFSRKTNLNQYKNLVQKK